MILRPDATTSFGRDVNGISFAARKLQLEILKCKITIFITQDYSEIH
jgi:hypothetical protein